MVYVSRYLSFSGAFIMIQRLSKSCFASQNLASINFRKYSVSCQNGNFLNARRFVQTQASAKVDELNSIENQESAHQKHHQLRNIAIIAHVDHGKTSLVDCLLKMDSSITMNKSEERLMDSNALEKERGITILSKTASITYKDHRINIVDTPGHADFGGEVERVLSMVDGVALLVDATEGPMTQTRFVLTKALQQNLRPLVIVNKVDRPTARLHEVESEILDLFLTLEANDDQLSYPLLWASAKQGWASTELPSSSNPADDAERMKQGVQPLLDLILSHIPPPRVQPDQPFSMLVTQLEHDSFVGKCLLGRVQSGCIRVGDTVSALDEAGTRIAEAARVVKMFQRRGLERVAVEEATAGDIVALAGIPMASVNSTICAPSVTAPIPAIPIDPPTVSMTFSVNDSPFQGEDGKKLTSSMIRDRLFHEIETNVAMKVLESSGKDAFEVRGRGELHFGILLENMRREGFEVSVSPPRVIFRRSDKAILEPMEEVVIDVPAEMSGSVIQKLSKRRGEMKMFQEHGDRVRLVFEVPSRGLLGYVSEFKHETSGQGVINHMFIGYQEHKGPVDKSRKGSLISTGSGPATTHAIAALEPRGTLFIKPGDKVYAGMVVGEHSKEMDLEVNPVKLKQLTNIRAVSKDDFVKLTPPRSLSLEQTLSYIQDDEIIEVTPKNIRIRKKELDGNRRKAQAKRSNQLDAHVFE